MDDDGRFMEMAQALSDPNRLKILRILNESGPQCSCRILEHMDISQPTLSHHMSVLQESGLVRTIPTGRWYDYEIDRDAVRFIESFIGQFL